MGDLLIISFFLIITFITGSVIEKNHYKKIKQREIALFRKPCVSFGSKGWNIDKKIKKLNLLQENA